MILPSGTKSNVGQTDAAPGEERSKTTESKEPVKDDNTAATEGDIGKRRKCDDGEGAPQGTTSLVNVSENLGCIALFSQCGQSSGSTIDT